MQETYISSLQLAARFGISRSTLWRWAKTEPSFPQPVALSPGCTRWRVSEIEAWEAELLRKRKA